MTATKFLSWIVDVARWDCPDGLAYSLFVKMTDRECLVHMAYEGSTAQVEVDPEAPIGQVYAQLNEFAGLLVVRATEQEMARRRQRKAAFTHRPSAN